MSPQSHTLKSALIVDDDPLQQSILGSYFNTVGVKTVEYAANGRAALKKLAEHAGDFDIVVSDLKMPEMDGLALMRALKEEGFGGHLLVVSSAGERLVQSAQRLSRLHGFRSTAILCKPLNRDNLDAALRRLTAPGLNDAAAETGMTAETLSGYLDGGLVFTEYQPKIDVWSGRVVGAEALARIQLPTGEVLYPASFIAVAEQSGLIDDLTLQVVDWVLRDMKTWIAADCNIRLAFNVSATSIRNTVFTDRLLAKIDDAGVVKNLLTCELTETNVLEESAEVLESLTRIAINRIGISVDDFGTGFATIERLRDFAYSELKIDRSFAAFGNEDDFADASVRASILLGRNLGMRIVAEGIETRQQWDYIVKAGVDEVQGFLLGKPMRAGDFLAWYKAGNGVISLDAA